MATAASLVLVLSPVDWPLLLAAVGWGAGNALFMATGPAFMAENATGEERATLFSLRQGTAMLVGFAGSMIGGNLPGLFAALLGVHPESVTAYRATLLVATGVMTAGMVPLLMIRESEPPHSISEPQATPSLWSLSLWGSAASLLIPQLLIGLGAALLIPYLNVFFKQRFGVSDSLLGTIFAVGQLLMGLATLVAPMLADRWGKIRTVVLTELASLPFLMALGFAPVLPVAIGAFWMRAMLMNMGGPLYIAFAMEQVPKRLRGTVGAMMGLVWSAGQVIGPGISGLVQRSFGFTPLFVATGTTYLAGAVMTQALFGKKEAGGRMQAAGDGTEEEERW